MATTVLDGAITSKDPWNWACPKRDELMSLDCINPNKDMMRAKTAYGLRGNRQFSTNLFSGDIYGK